ncbi:MAG: hypothetical protein V5B32_04100 [Candidatus Accumulibacter sp. UW26]|jgi:hypothetical protein
MLEHPDTRPTLQSTPELQVDTLALTLPAAFERRAARIGRLTAEALAVALPMHGGSIAQLQLAPQRISAHWSDRRIAAELAQAIRQRIEGGV